MRIIRDVLVWWLLCIFILSGAARAAFDGAFFAFFRPQWEELVESLPEFIRWFL